MDSNLKFQPEPQKKSKLAGFTFINKKPAIAVNSYKKLVGQLNAWKGKEDEKLREILTVLFLANKYGLIKDKTFAPSELMSALEKMILDPCVAKVTEKLVLPSRDSTFQLKK